MASEWKVWACSEFCGVLPDGRVRPADESAAGHWRVDAGGTVRLAAARNGWASLRLVVEGAGEFAVRFEPAGDGVEAELHREFYHRMAADENLWLADALVPLAEGQKLAIPAPDNACPQQAAQGIWVDLFVARDAKSGPHAGRLVVSAGGRELAISLAVEVLAGACPDEDFIVMDHNAYGAGFLAQQYPALVPAEAGPKQWRAMIPLIHKVHRLYFEHHGLFHMLGMGQSGVTSDLFAPPLAGGGHERRVADWSVFDAHYGPLLDGAAFAGGRRPAAPIYSTYTPFSPVWPSDFVKWGQRGYRVEWIRVLRQWDAHFRERGWLTTIPEIFFNHKKRYRYFDWDGDEVRYARDNQYIRIYRGLMNEAVYGSPVPWRLRADVSWRMVEQFRELAGMIDFWVCGGFVSSFPDAVREGPIARGDILWTYSGTAGVAEPAGNIIQAAYRTFGRGFTGNEFWNVTDCGRDPWMAHNGGGTTSMYPGVRFGIDGPIPCVRLKVLRNAVQDVNLLAAAAKDRGIEAVRKDVARRIPAIRTLWQKPAPAMLELDPSQWTYQKLQRPVEPTDIHNDPLDALWWQPVRQLAQEVSRG